MGIAMRKVQNDARVKETLGEPVEVVSTRSDMVFTAHSDGTSEVKLGFAVRGPEGRAVAHVTLGSGHGSDRYWVKEITVYCRDADRRIEIGGVGGEIPEWLAIVLGLGGAAVWVVAIVLGVKAARRKGVSPRWMWFGIHPLGAVIAWAVIAWGIKKRIPPRTVEWRIWAANEDAANRLCNDRAFLFEALKADGSPSAKAFLDAMGKGTRLVRHVSPSPKGGFDVLLSLH